ncbi:serine/threonine protein kinase [Streptomyces olivaceus]|uniref:serine/threonine protein kinase n=1 Tax=Streptomyces olivaceus TaxID=47716 RepID=UPI0022EEE842|nr:serine/threonine-protein kinase [Streptomyces olivaceus]GHI99390.1 hypothetical protein TPA0906_12560 [Streptomyces olivaceus]
MQGFGDAGPRQIGGYRLLGRLGAGGMGDVYLARSERGRTVAIKLVREELASQEEFRARFRYEVEAARQVGGHWTAPVLDADTEAAVPWVATGYVAGPSLRQVVGHDHGPLPERSIRTLAASLAHALNDIHGAGIVHRDLKPSNVLVTIDGPRVVDFGIARALETVTDGRITHAGAFVGSPGFMAPEQVNSDRITPACDIFCLGSLLVYAATGKMPFGTAQTQVHVLMYRIVHEEPDLESVPAVLVNLIRDCLEKDPAARPSPREVLRRTDTQDTIADGRSYEPWLPGPLVAQLGRHAVKLLDTENPEPVAVPPSDATSLVGALPPKEALATEAVQPPEAAIAGKPAPAPPRHPPFPPQREPQNAGPATDAAPPHQPTAHAKNQTSFPPRPSSFPPPSPSRKGERIALLIFALIVALSVGSVIYNLRSGNGEPSGTATTPAASNSRNGTISKEFLHTWFGYFSFEGRDNYREITIKQGDAGDTVFFIEAYGDRNDSSGTYRCELQGKLAEDPKSSDRLRMTQTSVKKSDPPKYCTDGKSSTITLRQDAFCREEDDSDRNLNFYRDKSSAQSQESANICADQSP